MGDEPRLDVPPRPASARPDDPVASIPAASVRPGEPPHRPVRARRPLTPQSLVERADVAPRTAEAETVLRIYRRRREQIGRAHV